MERARGLPVVMLAWVMPAAVGCTSSVTTGEVTPPACTTHVHRVERHAFAGARLTVATVEDGGHLVHATQAAARTFALGVTELGGEFERGLHG